jgi:UDP-glucose 4-epimerase
MYASTAYVYSNHGSFYRVSKQAAESIIEEYSKEFDINFTFLRYGSLYGPRSQFWNGIKKFIKQINETGTLEYAGSGKEIREYINVEDAARIGVDLLDDKYINQALMITGQQVMRADDLFEMIFEILDKKLDVNYLKSSSQGDHYGNTPYRYTPKNARKIVPSEFIDLGQGLLDVIQEVNSEEEHNENK